MKSQNRGYPAGNLLLDWVLGPWCTEVLKI